MTSMQPRQQDPLWNRIRGVTNGYANGIVRLIGESYGRCTIQQAWSEFTDGVGEDFDCDDPNAELFFSWLFHRWFPTREKGSHVNDRSLYGVSPTRAYLDRGAKSLDPLLRCYLESCLATSPGFYETFNCTPDVGFTARDVLTGVEWDVSEGLASASLADGEITYAHLVSVEGTTLLEAISPVSFSPRVKRRLTRLRRCGRSFHGGPRELRELYFRLARRPTCQ